MAETVIREWSVEHGQPMALLLADLAFVVDTVGGEVSITETEAGHALVRWKSPTVRQWILGETEEASLSDQLIPLLSSLGAVVVRIGGVVAVGSDREEIEPGMYATVRAVVKWQPFTPARKLPKPPEPEVFDHEAEPEPVAVES